MYYHVYPSGNKVIKAFTANGFVSYDKSGDLFILQNDKLTDMIAKKIKITWRIQKNRQNSQAITLSDVDNHPQLCPICAALQMVLWAQRLSQSDSLMVACHIYKKKRTDLTNQHVSALFREVTKLIHA